MATGKDVRKVTGRIYHNPSKDQSYSRRTGFGLLNAKAALDLTLKWKPLPPEKITTQTVTFNQNTAKDTRYDFDVNITNTSINFIESVVLEVSYDADAAIDLRTFILEMTAPDGKKAPLYDTLDKVNRMKLALENYGHIRLLSNNFLGSDAVKGLWRVHFEQSSKNVEVIKKIKTVKITVRGH